MADVLGCMLSVDLHAANIHDAKSGISTAKKLTRVIRAYKNSAQMLDIEERLCLM